MSSILTPRARPDVDLAEATLVGESYGRLSRYRLRHKLFSGEWSEVMSRDCFDSGHAVILLPYNPERDEVVLIRQFRTGPWAAGAEPWTLECVAGRLDKESASAEETARAEAREEAGLTVLALEAIPGFFTSPGIFAEHLSAYCGRIEEASAGIHGLASEHEDIRAETYRAERAIEMALQGAITAGPSLVCLFWLALNHDRLRALWR
ncbi:MAG: NUDIX domain-containing protein [Alphaproteobacteria bacterium]